MAVAQDVERLEEDDQRLLLHVHDAEAGGDPGVGRRADVDQHRDGQVATSRPRRGVQPIVGGRAGPAIREGADAREQIDVVAVELAAEQPAARA